MMPFYPLYVLVFILLGGADAQAFDNKDTTQAVQITLALLFVGVLFIVDTIRADKRKEVK